MNILTPKEALLAYYYTQVKRELRIAINQCLTKYANSAGPTFTGANIIETASQDWHKDILRHQLATVNNKDFVELYALFGWRVSIASSIDKSVEGLLLLFNPL